ncbi:hypothetical protein C8242_13250 [Paracidovorax avenae]|nr:hypothetical protein C8232_09790 [Paracidovorax avenae]AVT10334.1 hypothetical protein C8242_13250 [Paracidovorax avenae]
MQSSAGKPDLVNLEDPDSVTRWVKELDTTESQLRDAVAQVGTKGADVEMHLKGARSSTNEDRMKQAPAGER